MTLPSPAARAFALAALLALPLTARAEPHTCALLKPADLAPLLGAATAGEPSGTACNWSAGSKQLTIARLKPPGGDLSGSFTEARKSAAEDPEFKVSDEKGIGLRAFTVRSPVGVALVALQGGQLLNLMFNTGKPGTVQDAAALKQVAKKALAVL
jgi:transcriptional regulator of nitric oxide reductase